MLDFINEINTQVNNFIWGIPALFLLVGTGILTTCLTKFFQVSHFTHWWKLTVGGIFKRNSGAKNNTDKSSISQFQALCTALAATVGTGNIAGVATAIATGGPGAVFWMWVAAFFGMMTNYSENVLGIFYRRKNSSNEWCGGAMYYLRDGLGSKKGCRHIGAVLAVLFSVFAVLASFGIGNLAQANTISTNIAETIASVMRGINPNFTVPTVTFNGLELNGFMLAVGIILVIIAALVIVGGLKRIASVTEKLVPFMVILYIAGTLIILIANITKIGEVFSAIFQFAFGIKAVAGAAVGTAVKQAVTMGFKRGVFSNEAGLGSSVMVHSASNVKEPVVQGMWGIFEVFADTIVVCTLTAFAILSSGLIDLSTGEMLTDALTTALVTQAFSTVFGHAGSIFVALAILLFAFSTILGWSYYGTKAWEYLFGTKSTMIYKVVFVLVIVISAALPEAYIDLPWNLSDTFNGLMMLPNLIGVIALSGTVLAITKNYVSRNIKKQTGIKPMLSAFKDIQQEHEKAISE